VRTNLARAVWAVRRQRHLRQQDVAERAGVSREVVSRIERGSVEGVTVRSLERVARALGFTLELRAAWRGAELDRLIDARHARLQELVARFLTEMGFSVRPEVSFSHYGDRGRVDVLALHPALRTLLVVEVKAEIADLQDTLGRLDVKARLGSVIAREAGWLNVTAVIPALVITDSRVARRTVAAHPTLFRRFTVRGRQATAWLHRPVDQPTGLLWFVKSPASRGVHTMPALRVRNRPDSRRL
jgi:transcriptional regulator with XRE-family HTH domain